MRLDPELQAIADEAMADIKAGRIGPREVDGIWWERRRENELTPDYLGRVVEAAGAPDMARDARAGHYDDYACPPEVADGLETLRLVRDLRREAKKVVDTQGDPYRPETRKLRRERFDKIEEAARNGEFDATLAESDRWAASEGGQAAFRELTRDMVPKVGRNEPCPCGSGRKYKRCHGSGR